MTLRNSIASLATIGALAEAPEAFAQEHFNHHHDHHDTHHQVSAAVEATAHGALLQGKYLFQPDHRIDIGVAAGAGTNFKGDAALGSAELVVGHAHHFNQQFGLAVELGLGAEFEKHHGHNQITPYMKLGALGEIAIGTNKQIFTGPFAILTKEDAHFGGTIGLGFDL